MWMVANIPNRAQSLLWIDNFLALLVMRLLLLKGKGVENVISNLWVFVAFKDSGAQMSIKLPIYLCFNGCFLCLSSICNKISQAQPYRRQSLPASVLLPLSSSAQVRLVTSSTSISYIATFVLCSLSKTWKQVIAMSPYLVLVTHTHTHTHTRLMALCPGLPGWVGARKVKPIWILPKQETVSGSAT